MCRTSGFWVRLRNQGRVSLCVGTHRSHVHAPSRTSARALTRTRLFLGNGSVARRWMAGRLTGTLSVVCVCSPHEQSVSASGRWRCLQCAHAAWDRVRPRHLRYPLEPSTPHTAQAGTPRQERASQLTACKNAIWAGCVALLRTGWSESPVWRVRQY